jgi:hypothetical protein
MYMVMYNVTSVRTISNPVAREKHVNHKLSIMKRYYQLQTPSTTAWERNNWLRYVPTWLKEFIRGVRNIIRWMPTIYKDRHWDHAFITDIIQKKLEFTRKELVTANRFVGVESVNKEITLALNLLERIKHGYYETEMFDYIIKSYDFVSIDGTGDYLTMQDTLIEEHLDDYLAKYKRTAKKLRKKYKLKASETERLAYKVSSYNQDKCERIFWKLMHYKLNHWWD